MFLGIKYLIAKVSFFKGEQPGSPSSTVLSNLTYLNNMFLQQADLLQDTRSLLINSSIMQISQDNDELKQSVRIADNELKIIMLTDQVHRIRSTKLIFF